MSYEPHAAFPAALASRQPANIETQQDVLQLITSLVQLDVVQHEVIPTLEGIMEESRSKIENLLAVPDDVLSSFKDEQMASATAGTLYILLTRLNIAKRSKKHDDRLLSLCSRFCSISSPEQLKMCSSRPSQFAWALLHLAVKSEKVAQIIPDLHTLLIKASDRGILSGVHAAFLEACLITRTYERAAAVLDETYVDVRSASPSYLDILTFFHHAGLISIATGDFARAKEFFSLAVSAPTGSAASAIQLLAAKRAILCELLVSGTYIHFPKYTLNVVTRVLDKSAVEYTKLAKAFEARNWTDVGNLSRVPVFAEDCNGTLVNLVLDSVIKRKILEIKEIYSRLSIKQLAVKVNMEGSAGEADLLSIIQHMISKRELAATISSDSVPVITFATYDNYSDPTQTWGSIGRTTDRATWLTNELMGSNRQIATDKLYLKKQVNMLNFKGGKDGHHQDDVPMSFPGEARGGKSGWIRGVGGNQADMGY